MNVQFTACPQILAYYQFIYNLSNYNDLYEMTYLLHRYRDECYDSPSKAMREADRDFPPNIYQLLLIACTLPVTSVECERSISRLRYLKNYLRSTMTESQLNGLAHLYIHRVTLTELLMNLHESIKKECTSEICVLLTKLTDHFGQTFYLL